MHDAARFGKILRDVPGIQTFTCGQHLLISPPGTQGSRKLGNTMRWSLSLLMMAILALAEPASLAGPRNDQVSDRSTETSGESSIDLSKYGVQMFDDPRELSALLNENGRCPTDKLGPRGEPCVLLWMRRADSRGSGQSGFGSGYFKQVFEVDAKKGVLAISGPKMTWVRIDRLYWEESKVRGMEGKYRSAGIIGNVEDRENCAAARPCLANVVTKNLFQGLKLPDVVVNAVWGGRGPEADPGTRSH